MNVRIGQLEIIDVTLEELDKLLERYGTVGKHEAVFFSGAPISISDPLVNQLLRPE